LSLNIIPGYDFTFNELVTSEKLRKWIGGAHNTASLTASEVGVIPSNTGDNLHTTATWATSATVGALTFNTSTGWVELTTDVGSVPIFGTQGGLFTKRLREGESSEAAFDRFYEGDIPNVLGVKPGLTPTLPAANYTTGEGYDNFGLNSVNVAAAIQGASDLSGHRASKTFARYPSEHSYNPAGAWTVATYVTGTSYVHSLYKLGGLQTLRFKIQNGGGNITAFTVTGTQVMTTVGVLDLAGDDDNNLLFVPSRETEGLLSYYVPDNASSISLVSSNAVANEGRNARHARFDSTNRRLHVTTEDDYYSIFEVDTLGNLTLLGNYSINSDPRGMDYYDGYTIIGFDGAGMQVWKVNDGTNATMTFTNDPGAAGPCCITRSGAFYVFGDYDGGAHHVYAADGAGGASKIDSGSLFSDCYDIVKDNKDDSFFYVGDSLSGWKCFEINSTGSIALMDSNTQDGFTVDCRDNYLFACGNADTNVYILDKSCKSSVSLVHQINCSDRARAVGFVSDSAFCVGCITAAKLHMLKYYTPPLGSTTVSGLRGDVLDGVWEVESSTASNNPTRIVPLSQCFNYYGTQQLSVGFVQAILGKTDFRTGGYEF